MVVRNNQFIAVQPLQLLRLANINDFLLFAGFKRNVIRRATLKAIAYNCGMV